ncbi:MAG TPA: heavy metal-associated domain-containing protein [Mobilitalea sp.]|nr:heavy metal-associated domain-containing protein [Mobilitalea sp.]
MNNVHYNVNGLYNIPMKTQLKNALEELDGVQMVNVDLKQGTVEVGYNEPAKESDIRKTIEHIGCKVE